MPNISDIITHLDITQKTYKVKKPAKNEDRLRYIDRLSGITGWQKRAIHFQTLHFPDSWLLDIIHYCECYSNPKLRNAKLKEFLIKSKS